MMDTGYPYEGFEDMFPSTQPTPEWYGFGHKHLAYNKVPVRHLVLVDGQEKKEIDIHDPDHPLDHVVADRIRGAPAERAPYPISRILTITHDRPGAREGMEYGQFDQPNTTPGLLPKHRSGRR